MSVKTERELHELRKELDEMKSFAERELRRLETDKVLLKVQNEVLYTEEENWTKERELLIAEKEQLNLQIQQLRKLLEENNIPVPGE